MSRVEPYAPELDDAIGAFFADAHAREPSFPRVEAAGWRAFVATSRNDVGRGFACVRVGDAVVGLLTSDLRESPRALRHLRVLVHPAQRSRGLGSTLLEHASSLDESALTLQTLCPAAWTAARAFYDRRGFVEVARELHLERATDLELASPGGRDAKTDTRVRLATASDVDDVVRIHCEAYDGTLGFTPLTREQAAAWVTSEDTLLLVTGDETVRGFLAAEIESDEVFVESVAVRPNARRVGHGRALMNALLTRAGSRRVALNVDGANAAARALYESQGFRVMRWTARMWRSR